jgi:hypothetical protein
MIWKGPFRFSRLLTQPVRPIFRTNTPQGGAIQLEANMGEVIQFIPKAERERIRLIREARAMYDSIFPTSHSVNERRDQAPMAHSVSRAGIHHVNELLS